MAQIQALNNLGKAGKGKMDPVAACPAAQQARRHRDRDGRLHRQEQGMVQHSRPCRRRLQAGARARRRAFAAQACAVAAKMKKMRSSSGAGRRRRHGRARRSCPPDHCEPAERQRRATDDRDCPTPSPTIRSGATRRSTLRPYVQLARLDRPIGWWLLLLPCWEGERARLGGAAAAAQSLASCAVLHRRGRPCAAPARPIMTIVDREIDAKVERTAAAPARQRPRHACARRSSFSSRNASSASRVLLSFNGVHDRARPCSRR